MPRTSSPKNPALPATTALATLLTVAIASFLAAFAGAGALRAEPQTRAFRQAFPVTPGVEIRLANLAGQVELVAGPGSQVVIDATVHAEASGSGETQRLLDEMKWVPAQDAKGRAEWALAYPVDRYHSFFYPTPQEKTESSFWSLFNSSSSSTTYRGERVRVYTGHRSSAPTLYADLRITLPAASAVALRNLVGKMHGGTVEGTLSLDTGNGDIRIDAFSGQLRVDTGSGDVILGTSRGETAIDTGSGDVDVRQLVGNASVDTGSGDVRIHRVEVGKLKLHTGSGDVSVRDGAAGILTAGTGSGEVQILGVESEELTASTGSGSVRIASSLAKTRRLTAKTGSGDVRIEAGPTASFDVTADQGSGELRVDFTDAVLRRSHRDKVVGARRGDGRTAIVIDTASGDCVIAPHASAGAR